VFLTVWILCAAYQGALLKRGWVPHDDGAFALSAQRVLHGEMPHRDFDELYTGGLTYMNAAAFRLWGVNLASLRWMLFLFVLAWIPAVFYIATRLVGTFAAGGITFLAVVASVPVYSAPVPSWYNLFFATFGTAALLRSLSNRCRTWLFIAGLCAGLSFLAKISGLYFLAAILFVILFQEQNSSRKAEPKTKVQTYSVFLIVGLVAFIAVLLRTIGRINPSYAVQFILPGLSIVAFVAWREFHFAHQRTAARFQALASLALPALIGFAIPVLAFAVPYIKAHALASLLRGVFVLPTKRFAFAALHPTHLRAINLIATAVLVLVLANATSRRNMARWQQLLVTAVCLALLIASFRLHVAYSFVWSSMVLLVPVSVIIGLLMLRRDELSQPEEKSGFLFVLVSVVALTSLIQFPFAAPIYFCYVTPLLALTCVGIVAARPHANHYLLITITVFYIAFWICLATPGFIYNLGLRYAPNSQTASLDMPRGGDLRVTPDQAQQYLQLVSVIGQHSNGEYIYAAPDCPEVYFLTGKRNPARTLFDFFDSAPDRDQRVLNALDRDHVNLIAISTEPPFSPPLEPALLKALVQRYPSSEMVGRFQIRWRQ